jgi:GNAT superfamily N-acetyltransferase
MIADMLDRLARRFPVTPAAPSDLDAAVGVFRAAWPAFAPERVERRFRHRYLDNPERGGHLLLCRDGERVIGCVGMIDFALAAGSRTLPATAPIDLAVLPEQRRLGVGPLLLHQVVRRDAVVIDANLNDEARALADRLGAVEIAKCEVLRRWLRPGDWLRRTALRSDGVPGFDGLWAAARGEYALAARRDGAVLAWRYGASPDRSFHVHVLDRAGERLAYAVTTTERARGPLRRATLVDFLFGPLPEEDRRTFLRGVLAGVARTGALCVDALANRPADVALLRSLGFRGKGFFLPFLLYGNAFAEKHPELRRGADWHLTFGDVDFYL